MQNNARTRATPLKGGGATEFMSRAYSFESGGLVSDVMSKQLKLAGAEMLERPYEEAGWVHACLRAKSTSASAVRLVIYQSDDPRAEEVPPDDPVLRLLQTPNQHQSLCQLIEAGVVHRGLDGEDIWFLWGQDNKPLVPFGAKASRFTLPSAVTAVRGSSIKQIDVDPTTGLPTAYHFPAQAREGSRTSTIQFAPESVVHFRNYDPNNPLRGIGEAEVALRDLAIEFQAQRYNEAILRNGGDPGGFIRRKRTLDPAALAGEQAMVDQQFGNSGNRGKWKVIDGEEVDIVPNKISPKDMEFESGLKMIRDKVCSIMGVPLPIIGVLDKATYSNFGAAERQFWLGPNGIVVYLNSVADTLNSFFFPRFPEERVRRYRCGWDYSNIRALQDDNREHIESAAKIAGMGVGLSFEEVLNALGVDFKEGSFEHGQVKLGKVGLIPFDQLGQEPPAPSGSDSGSDPDPDEEVDPEREEAERKLASIQRRRLEYERIERDVMDVSDQRMKKSIHGFLTRYEKATMKRLADFAKNGVAALGLSRAIDPDTLFEGGSLSGDDFDELLLDKLEWEERLAVASEGALAQSFALASLDIAEELGVAPFSRQHPSVVDFLRTQLIQLKEGVTSTLANNVRKTLVDHFGGSTDIGTLQDLIARDLPGLEGSLKVAFKNKAARALTIARTETAHATNGARFLEMKKAGVQAHEWSTARDEFVRSKPPRGGTRSHVQLEGVVRPIGDEFDIGLKYPSDPEAPAGHTINCRCVALPVVEQ